MLPCFTVFDGKRRIPAFAAGRLDAPREGWYNAPYRLMWWNGRHRGLKIPCSQGVRVRVPPSARQASLPAEKVGGLCLYRKNRIPLHPANLLDKTPHIEENETSPLARAKRMEKPTRHLAQRVSRGPKALRRSPEGSALWRGSPRGSAPWASHAQSIWRNLPAISRNGCREGRRPFAGVQRAAPSGGVPQGAAPLGPRRLNQLIFSTKGV